MEILIFLVTCGYLLVLLGCFIMLLAFVHQVSRHAKAAADSAERTETIMRELQAFWMQPPSP